MERRDGLSPVVSPVLLHSNAPAGQEPAVACKRTRRWYPLFLTAQCWAMARPPPLSLPREVVDLPDAAEEVVRRALEGRAERRQRRRPAVSLRLPRHPR